MATEQQSSQESSIDWQEWEPPHKLTRELLDALKGGGWQLTALPFPGCALFSHPRSGEHVPNEYHEYFFRLRQLSVLYNAERFTAIWRREGTPVNGATERALSFRKAIAYVAEEWTP